jgi:hypothetical protein
VTGAAERFPAGGKVEWEANENGYRPFLSAGDEQAAASLGPDDVPQLIDALTDEDDFVKAHVLLTRLSGVEYESFPTWNGLALTMDAEGAVSIDPAQRERLAYRWQRWWAADPRPPSLPADD